MKRTPLKRKSDKQKERDAEWFKVKLARAQFLTDKYGHIVCEYCGKLIWDTVDGHHLDRNRRNNTEPNCYLCHRICHSLIHHNGIKVKQLGFEGVKE